MSSFRALLLISIQAETHSDCSTVQIWSLTPRERTELLTASSMIPSQGEPNLSLFYNTAGNSIALEPLVGLRFNLIRFSFKRERKRSREAETEKAKLPLNHCILKLSHSPQRGDRSFPIPSAILIPSHFCKRSRRSYLIVWMSDYSPLRDSDYTWIGPREPLSVLNLSWGWRCYNPSTRTGQHCIAASCTAGGSKAWRWKS